MRLGIAAAATTLALSAGLFAEEMPFPQSKTYEGCIKPSVEQKSMNSQVQYIYEDYKSRFLKTSNTPSGGKYIYSPDTDGQGMTTSEAHGWGMVITVMMAGYDSNAKATFDAMLKFYEAHKTSEKGSNLMSWKIAYDGDPNRTSNATDGDMDIAYALILASKQWKDGSYLTKAKAILNDVWSYNINQDTEHILLGNWAESHEAEYNYTRPSDWMAGHVRIFADATEETKWDGVANTVYDVYKKFNANPYASEGLIADFVYYDGTEAHSSEPNFLETEYDGAYHTNAARVPFRMAADYAKHGTADAKTMLNNLNDFTASTIKNPGNIKEGYWLNGDVIKDRFGGATYLAPFVAAAIGGSNKTFLTNGWNYLYSMNVADAYQAAIRLQCMLLISGNWWDWNDANTVIIPDDFDTTGIYFDDFADSDLAQSKLGYDYGKVKEPDSIWSVGGYWYTYASADGGEVQSASGTVIDENNSVKMFNASAKTMDIKIKKSGVVAAGFPKDEYYDLSDLSGVTVKAKGDGEFRVTLITDDSGDKQTGEFWGGFGVNLTLGSSVKEYRIPVGLLAPAPYSLEQEKNWSWSVNGKTKVKGINIAAVDAESNIELTVESVKLNGLTTEDFNFKPIVIDSNFDTAGIILEDFSDSYGDHKQQSHLAAVYGYSLEDAAYKGGGYWSAYGYDGGEILDKDGEDASADASMLINDKRLVVTLKESGSDKDYPGAVLELPFPDKDIDTNTVDWFDISNLAGVVIKAKGSGKVRMSFMTEEHATDMENPWYGGFGADIELTGSVKEHKISAKLLAPVQYSAEDVDKKTWKDHGSKKVKGIKFETVTDKTDATIEIEMIKLSGLADSDFDFTAKEYNPEGVLGTESMVPGVNSVATRAGLLKANLFLANNQQVKAMLVNSKGQIITEKVVSAKAGLTAVNLDTRNIVTGVYYLLVRGSEMNFQKKVVLQ